MKHSYYSMLNTIIRQKKSDGKFVIDREEIAKLIDLKDEDEEEKDRILANFMATNMLNENGYRSCVKGRGIYIDTDALNNKTLATQLANNTNIDINTRKEALHRLERLAEDLPEDTEYRQIFFDMEGTMLQEMTKEELIKIIKDMQEGVN